MSTEVEGGFVNHLCEAKGEQNAWPAPACGATSSGTLVAKGDKIRSFTLEKRRSGAMPRQLFQSKAFSGASVFLSSNVSLSPALTQQDTVLSSGDDDSGATLVIRFVIRVRRS
jgi:hypothetical protein